MKFVQLERRPGIRNTRQTGNILTGLLSLIVIAYSLLYFNNTYPISEGWGINYVELLAQGKVPYRDFYYYLPPLNLVIDAIFWKLSFGFLLAFRGWYLLQRVVIYVLLFRLLRKYFNQFYAFLACVLTAFIATGDVYDLIGDYNQTMGLISIMLVYCAVNFARAPELKKKLLHMGAAGILFGCLLLNKQTIFVACGVVFFIMLTALCIVKRDKNYWWYCLAVAIGFFIPTGIAFAYLWFNDALIPFFEQVFLNVDGKGSLVQILVKSIASRLWQPALLSIVSFIYALVTYERNESKSVSASLALVVGAALVAYSNCMFFEIQNVSQIVIKYRSAIAALAGCGVICIAALWLSRKGNSLASNREPAIAATASVLCLGLVCSICFYADNFSNEFYFNSGVFNLIQNAFASSLLLGGLALLPLFLYLVKASSNSKKQVRYESLLFIACGAFALLYAGSMGSGNTPPSSYALRIITPFAICLLLNTQMRHKIVAVLFKGGIIAICIMLSLSCVSQKVSCSYSWWGSYMAHISEKTYAVDVPAMAGIRVSADQKELYESITHAIEKYSDEDDVVWGYPHIKLFNILTNRYNMDTFVPVLFYDVAADVYVEQEAKLLRENPPEVVVWEDIPYCVETHENVFRDGEPLKQRQIISLFDSLLPESYVKVEQVGNVSLYIRNDVYEQHTVSAD